MDVSRIKMLVMDVDGTLTDGKIYMGPDGEAMKAFDVKDGYAIAQMLPAMGIVPVVITGRESAIVERRCAELGIAYLYQGVSDKLGTMRKVIEEKGIGISDVAYMGDDLNDLGCMRAVVDGGGIAACPADADGTVRETCVHVCLRTGGDAAVREFLDWLSDGRGDACAG